MALVTKKKLKKIKIIKVSEFVQEHFKINVGDKFDVVRSQLNEDTTAQVVHLVYTKNKKAICFYSNEVVAI